MCGDGESFMRCCQQELSLSIKRIWSIGILQQWSKGNRYSKVTLLPLFSISFGSQRTRELVHVSIHCRVENGNGEWDANGKYLVHLPNFLMHLAFSSLLPFLPLIFPPLLVIVTPIFKYLILEHCGFQLFYLLASPIFFFFFSVTPLLTSWSSSPIMTSLLPSLRSSAQGYFPFFSIHSCPHVHASYFSQLGFPRLSLGSPLTPLLLCL